MRAIHMAVFAVGVGWAVLQPAQAQQQADWVTFQQAAACEMPSDCGVDFCSSCNLWTATADALLLHRTTAGRTPLFFDNATGGVALEASDLDFDFEPGYRVGLIRHGLLGCWGLEVGFLGIDSWSSETTVVTGVDGSFTENFAGFDFDDIADFSATYGSDLYSGEVNLRRELGGPVTFLTGFRIMELNEDLLVSGSVVDGFTDILLTSTDNRLYGGQFGVDADLLCRGRLRVNSVLKGGVFYNRASQTSLVRTVDATGTPIVPDVALGDDRNVTSFVGELGITGTYQLTSWLGVRTGYDLLWLSQVALAPHQTNNTDLINTGLISVDTGGDVLAHGAFLGLELTR